MKFPAQWLGKGGTLYAVSKNSYSRQAVLEFPKQESKKIDVLIASEGTKII